MRKRSVKTITFLPIILLGSIGIRYIYIYIYIILYILGVSEPNLNSKKHVSFAVTRLGKRLYS